jgi:hypothetical protein
MLVWHLTATALKTDIIPGSKTGMQALTLQTSTLLSSEEEEGCLGMRHLGRCSL